MQCLKLSGNRAEHVKHRWIHALFHKSFTPADVNADNNSRYRWLLGREALKFAEFAEPRRKGQSDDAALTVVNLTSKGE